MSSYLRVIKGTSFLTSADLGSKVLALARIAFITRFISVSDYGIFALAMGTTYIFANLVMPQYGSVVLRYFPEYRRESIDEAKNLISSSLFMSIIFSLVVFAVLEILAQTISVGYYGKEELTPFLKLAGVVIFVSCQRGILQQCLMSLEKFKAISIGNISFNVLDLLLTLLLVKAGWGINGIIYATILAHLAVLIGYFSLIREWVSVTKPRLSREVLKFWYPIALASLIKTFTVNLPLLIIGRSSSADVVGFYNIALTTATAIYSVFAHYTDTINVVCMNIFQESRKEFSRILNMGIRHLAIVSFLVAGLILYFPEQLLSLLYGAKYAPVAPLFIFVMLYLAITQLFFFSRTVYFAFNRTKIYLIAGIIRLILQIVLLLIFVPGFGFMGVGYALLLFSIVGVVMHTALSIYVGVEIKISNLLVPAALFALLGLPLKFVVTGLPLSILSAALFASIYTLILIKTSYLEWKEIMALIKTAINYVRQQSIQNKGK